MGIVIDEKCKVVTWNADIDGDVIYAIPKERLSSGKEEFVTYAGTTYIVLIRLNSKNIGACNLSLLEHSLNDELKRCDKKIFRIKNKDVSLWGDSIDSLIKIEYIKKIFQDYSPKRLYETCEKIINL